MISAIVSEPNKVRIMNAINYDKEGNVEQINTCIFQSGYFNQPEQLKDVKYWIDCGDSKFCEQYIESNLPVPLAKSRALEFLGDFFSKSAEKVEEEA